jgi:hypothetical protein
VPLPRRYGRQVCEQRRAMVLLQHLPRVDIAGKHVASVGELRSDVVVARDTACVTAATQSHQGFTTNAR